MNTTNELLAIRIRELRVSKNMKQAELDEAAELPRSTVSKIERGIREASASDVIRISEVLGVSIDTLLGTKSSFVYEEEMKVIEALREINFEDYARLVSMLESFIYFKSRNVDMAYGVHLRGLVMGLKRLTESDVRPRGWVNSVKKVLTGVNKGEGAHGATNKKGQSKKSNK